MKLFILLLTLFPFSASAQVINNTENKNTSNIYNDAIKRYLTANYHQRKDTLFVEKRENYDDSVMNNIGGTVVKIMEWQEIETKLALQGSFTLHRFFH